MDKLERVLSALGFVCHRLRFEEAGTPAVDNLYARLGRRRRISASPAIPMWCRRAKAGAHGSFRRAK